MNKKDYIKWMKLKKLINNSARKTVFYKERDIWWVSVGENIGSEQDGKGELFFRPVLVIKGFNKELFWGVPLSTTKNRGRFYHPFQAENVTKVSVALLSQMRPFDTGRLVKKEGIISIYDFTKVKAKIKKFL
ncbi:MAG: type II toxin-antitoxin system PemK/MazF family toxin [Candidatus Nomurabacteria bacterium]|jgi:mRNA-degrading endonuclease toxin of MazEF toxin-antitoxin module|nr:type II toxin-antitoxin system PemK/MazF family toxin [Candidatus Nomurabacteria bacterium]